MQPDFSIRNTSPWISVDLAWWEPITQGRTPTMFRKKSFLFHQDEEPRYVYIVKSGRIRLTSFQPDGAEKQLYIAEVGALCGESSCAQRHPHQFSAVAIVDSLVYCVPYWEVEAVMRGDWELAQRVMQVMCRKNSIYIKQIMDLSFSQSLHRVAQILLNIAGQYGTTLTDGSVRISIHFTHQDVASMINTSRVTVSNIFNMLTEQGLLDKEDGCFILRDIPKFKEMAEYFDAQL